MAEHATEPTHWRTYKQLHLLCEMLTSSKLVVPDSELERPQKAHSEKRKQGIVFWTPGTHRTKNKCWKTRILLVLGAAEHINFPSSENSTEGFQ